MASQVGTLLHLAVAGHDIGVIGSTGQLGRFRHADGNRQAVAERTSIGLDAGHLVAIRVAVEPRMRL